MVWYNVGKSIMLNPNFNWGTAMPEAPFDLLNDSILIALMLTTYTVNIDTHLDFADISTSEIANSSVTGYTARGDATDLTGKSVATDNANDRSEFTCTDHTYSAIGNATNATFDQIVVLRENETTPTNADSPLIAHATVASTTTNGGDVTLQINAEGLLQITA